ncbi:MAG TPA: glycosyltransferase family 4 protein [Terracidiphilus sp.]|nr:glycosyltransferase family 4 protein [Terracidiphilus sp.]
MTPTKVGSLERFFQYLAAALDAAGWDTVLCFDGPISAEFNEYFAKPYIILERLDNQGNLGVSAAGALWKLLNKHRPKVFVYAFHGVMRCFPWLARLAGCKRIFFNDHSSRPFGQITAPLSLPKRITGRLLTAPITAVVSVADFTRRTGSVFGICTAQNVVVTNGVEVRSVDKARGLEFRQRFGIAREDVVVTQVCWMVEVKGVETMLEAFSRVLQKRSGVHLLLVGGGSELEKYRQLAVDLGIAQAVTFTGIISNPTQVGVFDASDLYCQPSIWQEACPLAVLEAMSFKLPVIASNTGGLPELVSDGRNGILFPVRDIEKLQAALERLLEDADLRRAMGEDGYQSVLKEHRIEDTVGKYADVFLGRAPAENL